jgi:hypothetical protein
VVIEQACEIAIFDFVHPADFPFRHLVVIHYHWRAGGVRRIVEISLPAILQASCSQIQKTTLLSGTPIPESHWMDLPEVSFCCEPAMDYYSAQALDAAPIAKKIQATLHRVIPLDEARQTLLWFHNPALARNMILNREVLDFVRSSGASLIMHHHDFWCDGRWARWPEMEVCGFGTLQQVANATLESPAGVGHVTINIPDFQILRESMGERVHHLPNPVSKTERQTEGRREEVREWVQSEIGAESPIWVFPTRFLRRKNILEAVLLTRWLCPEAVFVTTSGAASRDEEPYAAAIKEAARCGGWRVWFGLLDKPETPDVAELLQVSDVALLTSIQEGFGMGFVEAAAASTPLIARSLPHVMPDLNALGFHFPNLYDEIWIDASLIDVLAEKKRVQQIQSESQSNLPDILQQHFNPADLDFSQAVPFSRLTIQGQLEVLSHEPALSWAKCQNRNPILQKIKSYSLQPTKWPTQQVQSADQYARNFLEIAGSLRYGKTSGNAEKTQRNLIDRALNPDAFYPILSQAL